jgi:outer membrane protein
MNKIKSRTLILIIFLLGNHLTVKAFDFEELINISEKTDPQLSSARNSREAAAKRLEQASTFINPNASFIINSAANSSRLIGIPGAETGRMNEGSKIASLTLTQPIFNPLRGLNIEEAKYQQELETVKLLIIKNEIILRVTQTLIDISAAYSNSKSFSDEVNNIKNFILRIKQEDSSSDLSFYETRLIQSESQEKISRNIIRQRLRDLSRLSGSSDLTLSIEFDSSKLSSLDFSVPNLEAILDLIDNRNLNLIHQRIEVNIFSANVKRALRDKYPTIDFFINASTIKGMQGFPSARIEAASFGIQINTPIGDGGISSVVRTEAVLQESRAKNELESLRKSIQQNASDLYHEINNGKVLIHAEQRAQGVREKWKSQLITASSSSMTETASTDLEETLAQLVNEREIGRLNREAFMNQVRLWALTGPLEKEKLTAIGSVFK